MFWVYWDVRVILLEICFTLAQLIMEMQLIHWAVHLHVLLDRYGFHFIALALIFPGELLCKVHYFNTSATLRTLDFKIGDSFEKQESQNGSHGE